MKKTGKIVNKKNIDKIHRFIMVFVIIFLFEIILRNISRRYLEWSMCIVGQVVNIILIILFLSSCLSAVVFQLVYWYHQFDIHVAKYQGEKCFERIDFFMKNLGEYNDYYCSGIREINRIYATDCELEKLVQDNNLSSLYARKSYLENKLDLHSNITQIITAMGVSVVVAFAQTGTQSSGGLKFGWLPIALIGIWMCFIWKYIEKGKGDTYIYNIYEYELELLVEKISLVNQKLQADEGIEKVLQMRQMLINGLINLYRNPKKRKRAGFKKRNLNKISQELYDLPLLQELQRTDIIWGAINICGQNAFFPLTIEEGKYKCLDENYEKVYNVLQALNG